MWDMNRGNEDNSNEKKAQQHNQQLNSANSGSGGEQQVKFEKKSEIENQSSGIDSGFMSGPQLSAYDSSEEEVEQQEIKKLNITSSVSNTKTTANRKGFSDSGCAEDDEHIATDSGLSLQESSGNKHMIVDSGVDVTGATTAAGLSEWFCNLSLKENQQINNLNFTKKQSSSSSSAGESRQQQQHQQKQPWQIYYQQNSDGDTQLHIACITGYVDVVSALIQLTPHPCLLDIQNDEALTALHIAVLTGQTNIVRMLVVGGASPVIRDRNGNTALHLACSFGDLKCVKALTTPITANEMQQQQQKLIHWQHFYNNRKSSPSTLTSSSSSTATAFHLPNITTSKLPQDLELRNYDGERCVHLAAQSNHIDVLRYLVSLGADINAREGKSGRTPLHIAIEMCNEELANFLLEECHKLNLETATYAGLTAYQLAVMVRFSQMQSNLEKHGAEPLTPPDSDQDSDYDDNDDSMNAQQQQDSLYNRLQSSHNGQNTTTINVS